ncbi:hypothetical protein GGR56DRAFT_655227 [Xylariaceae sp. FL0804]|nr:hypothetical protein GGR56DRAFT_655227 [Xylariaceae sp. FL0804]
MGAWCCCLLSGFRFHTTAYDLSLANDAVDNLRMEELQDRRLTGSGPGRAHVSWLVRWPRTYYPSSPPPSAPSRDAWPVRSRRRSDGVYQRTQTCSLSA